MGQGLVSAPGFGPRPGACNGASLVWKRSLGERGSPPQLSLPCWAPAADGRGAALAPSLGVPPHPPPVPPHRRAGPSPTMEKYEVLPAGPGPARWEGGGCSLVGGVGGAGGCVTLGRGLGPRGGGVGTPGGSDHDRGEGAYLALEGVQVAPRRVCVALVRV